MWLNFKDKSDSLFYRMAEENNKNQKNQKDSENSEGNKTSEDTEDTVVSENIENAQSSGIDDTDAKSDDEIVDADDAENTVKTTKGKIPIANFNVGDTVKVFYKIIESGKTRIQPYEGIVISKKGSGNSKTFTVRRIGADNIGVERIFPLFSPNITKINVLRRGKVRRAKLYYLRGKKGREATRLKEKV